MHKPKEGLCMAKVNSDIKKIDISVIIPSLMSTLNERDKRIFLGALSRTMGYGGTKTLSELSGVAESTIRRGAKELDDSSYLTNERIRAPGAGRKNVYTIYPDLKSWVEKTVRNETYGDPMSERRWTSMSLRHIASVIQEEYGVSISHVTIGMVLEDIGYSKQKNQKMLQVGENHPDRDRQFKYIRYKSDIFMSHGQPVISIDCKKKENLGDFASTGREYRKKKDPRKSKDHDFKDKQLGSVAPYGVYVINNNTGFVNLGTSHDTSEFAGVSVMRWWEIVGKSTFPNAKRILITADGGGSNGYRYKAWKYALQQIANQTGLEIHVSHYPPGTSKWNKIEHRLFCFITKNWAGQHLTNIVTVVNLIANTRTETGLKVQCVADSNHYELRQKPSDEEYAKINILKRRFHEEWNYVVKPQFKNDQ